MTKLAILQAILLFSLTAQMPPVTTSPVIEKPAEQAVASTEPVFYFPLQIAYWDVSSGSPRTERLFMRQGDEHPLKITKILTSGKDITAEIVKSGGKERKTYTVAVTLSPTAHPGPVRGEVIIHTDHPDAKTIRIPVKGNILNDMAITPHSLTIRLKRGVNEGHGVLTITSTNRKKFNVLDIKAPSPGIKTDMREINNGKGYLILVTATEPAKSKKEPRQALLHISVDSPQKLVVAPITILP